MKKLLNLFLIVSCFLIISAENISADNFVAESSAHLKDVEDFQKKDYRVSVLENFFEKHNSPLSDYADKFVSAADDYNLDWRLVPAITGVESTFGKRIPSGSFNAYGWANGNYYFKSWEQSIEIVSKSLREKYINRGATTLDQIARRYAPPSSTWAWKVEYFMLKIDPLPLGFTI